MVLFTNYCTSSELLFFNSPSSGELDLLFDPPLYKEKEA
jgi:hypothetical protein